MTTRQLVHQTVRPTNTASILQRRPLAVNTPGDRHEREADRVADAVMSGQRQVAPFTLSAMPIARVQREEAPKEKTDDEKYKEAAGKLGEAFLATPLGKDLTAKVKQDKLVKGATEAGKSFIGTLPGKIVTGAAAVGAVTALAAAHKELPAQIPEIPLDVLTPGLSVEVSYKGPVDKPTEAMLTFKFTEQAPKGSSKKPALTESEKYRAETARIAADQAKFRAGLKYPPGSPEDLQQKAEAAAARSALGKYAPGPDIDAIIKKYQGLGTQPPTGGLQLTPPTLSFGYKPPALLGDEYKLKLPGEKKKEDEPALQRKAAGDATVNVAPPVVHDVVQAPGQPLDAGTRTFMESRLGHDFGQVRVHIDAKSADAARAVNAVAYTIGRDIVFTAGQYAPESAAGRRLLAHELTHVVQQRAAAAITPPGSLAQAWIQQTGEAMAPGPQPADRPPVASSDESGLEQDAERSARRLTNRGLGVAAASASPIPPPRNVLARAAVNAGISGAAEALPAALASHVRRHLDIDPEEVRIHRDTTAAAAARVLGANGYAYGHHVVLGHDAQNVDSPRGFATLAHELGHVAQQQAQPATGLTPRPQFSLKTYIAAMNKQPEPDWKTAAEHLNGEDPATIKQILKGLSQTYRAKLHEAAREWPGACSNIGQLTRADYLAAHPEIKSAPADSCDKKEAAPADAKAILTDATPAKAAAATAAPPASNARLGRVGAAIKLLKMQWDRYKANPQDKAIHDKYVVGIERFVVDTVTDHKMFKAFSRLAADEQRTGRDRCNEALSRVKSLESAFRTGYPRLDDERTWKSAIGAMGMAQRYLELIVNYREPIPLKDGWHLVVNDSGTVLGYFYLSQGYWKVLDDQGKFIESGEAPLERPLIDPIDIAAGGIAGVMRGAVVGAVEGALSTLARRAAPRVGAAMIAVDIGLETAVPGAIGRMAPRALIMSETLTSEAVSRVLANAGSTLPKATAAQAVSSEASAAANTTLSAAGGSAASGTMTGPASAATGISGAQSLAGGAGASATSNVAGATTVQVSPAEYAARLGFVFPQQFDNAVLNAVERAGQQAATVLSNASNPTGARFIQACQARQWTLAGTLFHAEAARQLTAIAATLTGQGIQITAEDTVQAGTGGSRLDVTAVDATGNHYNIDWKTTGRSALTAKARAELQRHAGQYAANRGATLDVQISKSWVDFVRALIPGVTWPK